jgi:GNAT superfamily N-acetyltransferase
VLPGRIGDGVGTALLEAACAAAAGRGARTLGVASDPGAEGFYLRRGARRIGEVPSRPAGRRLPLLRLDLAAPGT